MEKYFVISCLNDDPTVESISLEELSKRIDDDYWGGVEIVDKMPHDQDMNYWGESILIIKGEIFNPIK